MSLEQHLRLLNEKYVAASTAQGSDLAEYWLDEVDVRIYGDVALVRASGSWKTKDGAPGESRYVDVYVRTSNGWKAVSAQITRPARVS